MMGWYGQGGAGWWMLVMPVMWIAFLAVASWIVVMLTRVPTSRSARTTTPEDVLQRRLAAGDVTIEEYQRTLAALHAGHAPTL